MKHIPTIMLVAALLILIGFAGYYSFNLFIKNKTEIVFVTDEANVAPQPIPTVQPRQEQSVIPAGYDIWEQKLKIDNEPEAHNIAQEMKKAEDTLKNDPSNAQALYALAYYNFVQGYDAQARVYFDKIIQADSSNKDALYGKAYLFYKAKQPAKALEIVEKIEKIDPKDARPLIVKGIISETINDIPQAKVYYSKALQLDRTNKFAQKALMKIN